MKLAIVTTTTGRPWCFEQLQDYYQTQTLVPDTWFCVGEDHNGYNFRCNQHVIQRKPKKSEKGHSLGLNWLTVLPLLKDFDYILPFEDDDVFFPNFFKVLVDMLLAGASLAGLQNCVYYQVRHRRFCKLHNLTHSALTSSIFTRELLPLVKKFAKGESVYLDYNLFNSFKGKISFTDNLENNKPLYHVGLKGCPGLTGCGSFHTMADGSIDWGGSKLREWLGKDAYRYMDLFESYH
ncbi:MAG: hypothetical protein QM703_22770 [Gemmatales bacterium]